MASLDDKQKAALTSLLLEEAQRQDAAGNSTYLSALILADDKVRGDEFVALASKASVDVKLRLGDLTTKFDAEQKSLQELDATLDSLLIVTVGAIYAKL